MNKNDKRHRLIEAAKQLFHEQGVNTTTLAKIATLAEVPLGNVYYYFKSKESIIMAVIEELRRQLKGQLQELNNIPNHLNRLQTFITQCTQRSELTAAYGDALGSLCQELSKQGGVIAESASQLLKDLLSWCEEQFKLLGKNVNATQHALHLLATLQGISLLTLTFKEPDYLVQHTDFLKDWIESA